MNTEQKQHTYEVGIVGRNAPEQFTGVSLSVAGDAVMCADASGEIVFFAPTAAVSYLRRLDKAMAS